MLQFIRLINDTQISSEIYERKSLGAPQKLRHCYKYVSFQNPAGKGKRTTFSSQNSHIKSKNLKKAI